MYLLSLLQAANSKQAARHSEEVEELLLELSKLAQTAQPKQSTSNQADMKKSAQPEQEEEEDVMSLSPQAPRLTTPVSPSRRPSTHPRGFHTPPEGPPEQTYLQKDESLRAERGRSFTSSFNMSKQGN